MISFADSRCGLFDDLVVMGKSVFPGSFWTTWPVTTRGSCWSRPTSRVEIVLTGQPTILEA